MENKEFNLSEKRKKIRERFGILSDDHKAMLEEVLRIVEEQDKEFIRRLKEELSWEGGHKPEAINQVIDKLSGDRLK